VAQALADAQRRGIAEADPSLDIDGYDTANKLVLIANAMGLRARDNDVGMTQNMICRAESNRYSIHALHAYMYVNNQAVLITVPLCVH
jgi:homoserine dehydrogenase